jgi:CRISPR/Cas system-associated exonuclease Cas4 (RecB family)
MASNPKANLVTAWSFSRWMDYVTCPAKFKYKVIYKLTEPPNAAMQRGTDIHKLAEDYVKGKIPRLPAELSALKPHFTALKKQKVKVVEEQWAFKKDWTLTKWNDWTGCWLRVKLDVAYVNVEHNAVVPIDHKTGRFREEKNDEYLAQLHLYGVASLTQMPDTDVASPRLWYIDEGRVYPDPEKEGETEIEYFRPQTKEMRKVWEDRTKPMFMDRTFKPTPSKRACKFCHFRKANGGPCKY